MAKVINYYGSGNTSRGFKNFYDSIFQNLKKIYSLNGGSNNYKTKLLKELIQKYSTANKVEVINSAIDVDEIEGIIIRELDIAIVNGTPFHKVTLDSSNLKVIDIDLNSALNLTKLSSYEKAIVEKNKNFFVELKRSHNELEKALKIHDKWVTKLLQ